MKNIILIIAILFFISCKKNEIKPSNITEVTPILNPIFKIGNIRTQTNVYTFSNRIPGDTLIVFINGIDQNVSDKDTTFECRPNIGDSIKVIWFDNTNGINKRVLVYYADKIIKNFDMRRKHNIFTYKINGSK